MLRNIKVIGFDADDTLWVNEPYYLETENKFCALLEEFMPNKETSKELFATEMQNLELYGYGAKAFILSLLETSLRISNYKVSQQTIHEIINLGKELLNKPLELLDGVEDVLKELQKDNYKLIVATKGDLLDQERKLKKSGLEKYFHHIEIMSDKQESDYQKLLNHLDIKPEEFIMIGNSLKSDIIPTINLGCFGIHIPYHTTWQHEVVSDDDMKSMNYKKVDHISEVLDIIRNEKNN